MSKLKYQNKILIILMLLFGLLLFPSRVEAVATTRTVCPDPVGDCSPSDPTFKGAAGILLAIDASADGDIVSIKNGTYSGFTTAIDGTDKYFIILTKNLSIYGESSTGTILSGNGSDKGTMFRIKNTGNSSISNLSITGGLSDCPGNPCSAGSGIDITDTGSGTLTLNNLRIYNNFGYGIWSLYSSKVTVVGNAIYSNSNGVLIAGNSNLNLSTSTIYSNSTGVWYYENSTGTVSNSTVRNNTGDAIIVDDNSVVAVNNNLVYSNANVGLRLWETSHTTGTGNTIYSNLYTGHASGVYCTQSAVLGTWTNNNVWNNANGNYGSSPVELCTDKTGTNGNISVDPQSLLSTSSTSSSPTLPDTAIEENLFLKIILSFISLCIGIVFLSRHFDTISKEDN